MPKSDPFHDAARFTAFLALSIPERKAQWRSAPPPPPGAIVSWGRVCGTCVFRPENMRTGPIKTGYCTKAQGVIHQSQTCGQYQADTLAIFHIQRWLGREACTTCKFFIMRGADTYCGLYVPLAEQDHCAHWEKSRTAHLRHGHLQYDRERKQGRRERKPVVYYEAERPAPKPLKHKRPQPPE